MEVKTTVLSACLTFLLLTVARSSVKKPQTAAQKAAALAKQQAALKAQQPQKQSGGGILGGILKSFLPFDSQPFSDVQERLDEQLSDASLELDIAEGLETF